MGTLRAPIDSPEIRDFVAALDPVNRLADESPGFVWRLKAEPGDTTHVDENLVLNMSVWESYEDLHAFVYRTGHGVFLRRRLEWFERMEAPITALWWVPEGELPTVDDALARLEHLREHGPAPHAFSLRRRFDPAGRPVGGEGRASAPR